MPCRASFCSQLPGCDRSWHGLPLQVGPGRVGNFRWVVCFKHWSYSRCWHRWVCRSIGPRCHGLEPTPQGHRPTYWPQRQPEDAVVAGHWEYDYYFRRLGTAYHPLDQWPQLKLSEARLWLVITAHSAPERDAIIEALRQPHWQVAVRRDFVRTTAVLLIRTDHSSQGIQRTQRRPFQISRGPAKNPVP